MTLNTEAFAKALAAGIAAYDDAVLGMVVVATAVANSAADGDGWIMWRGGGCPVDEGTEVQVVFRDHDKVIREFTSDKSDACDWSWRHDQSGDDIIAYRVSK